MIRDRSLSLPVRPCQRIGAQGHYCHHTVPVVSRSLALQLIYRERRLHSAKMVVLMLYFIPGVNRMQTSKKVGRIGAN
jgi:hypothetical protein